MARQDADEEAGLKTGLFGRTVNSERIWFPLPSMPVKREEQQPFLEEIGMELCWKGWIPAEVVLLTGGWFVVPQKPSVIPWFAQSESHALELGIDLRGCTADKTRYTHVIQPVLDKRDRPVWQPLLQAVYNAPAQAGNDIVDFLAPLVEM